MSNLGAHVPVFTLYGEVDGWHTPELVHCEEIAHRSRPNGWLIRPHRHADLVQLFYIKKGQAEINLDGERIQMNLPGFVLVPMMSVHSFQFSDDIMGYVISLAAPLVKQVRALLGHQHTVLDCPFTISENENGAHLYNLFTLISDEYRNNEINRKLLLESAAASLVVLAVRLGASQLQVNQSHLQDRNAQYYARFLQLIEMHYREHIGLEDYADKLHMNSARLNTICRRVVDRSALQVIHLRLAEEAKRNLIYTSMSISEIADVLGFSEPAYFTRFFKRLTNQSPKDFRKGSFLAG